MPPPTLSAGATRPAVIVTPSIVTAGGGFGNPLSTWITRDTPVCDWMVVAAGPWPWIFTLLLMSRSSSTLASSVFPGVKSLVRTYVPASSAIVSVATLSGSPAGHSPAEGPEGVLSFAADTASRSEQKPSVEMTLSVRTLTWMAAAWAGAANAKDAATRATGRHTRRTMDAV